MDSILLQEAETFTTCVKMCSDEFTCYADQVMRDFDIAPPTNLSDCLKLFFLLLDDIST